MQREIPLSNFNASNFPLPWTGERFLPEMGGDIRLEHLHRYLIALQLIRDKDVLDVACGEGYGTQLLCQTARSAVGVDISKDAIGHARANYSSGNLRFLEGDCTFIPLNEESIDVVISFETLEHHDRHEEMISEIRRVLRPNGILLISTPDKLHYSDEPNYHNEFHVKELYSDEFRTLLQASFRNIDILGQRICYGSVIASVSNTHRDYFRSYENSAEKPPVVGVPKPNYLIAIATDGPLPVIGPSLFDGTKFHHDEFVALSNAHARATQQLIQTSQHLENTLNSFYWRITFPLRALRQLIRKVFQV